ncbi:anti-sigma-F factor Fin [Acetohalobium arabaticum]|uniref:Uncharacterized protein n=1 Tax=Acetohalobium arabaticum (strain ATCC 49924 / DSM 5501 / Z-7288) TaxID=574087 RepID=D9QSV4_ACEAZ|nr:anti-sigma-F factor Fin [Acetohalobium arabaticum]ADL11642.1 conserved hypothetical protein [Acetohalobium arabaticum DSM 5501]
MKLVYYCSQCNDVIDRLEVDAEEITEDKLGFSILTPGEKEDIINETEDEIEIGIICDDCEAEDDLISLVNNNLIH